MSVRASHLIINDVDYEIWDTVARNGIGAPATASTVAGMTDTSKVYVYTGSETGYTAGNWYYYNGSAWVSGGIYNSTAFETDETLTEQGAAADAKAVGDAIDALEDALATKAEVDGAYDSMTVGNAEQLVSNVGIEDSVPYNFRTSGGSADIGDREVDKIVGGTIAWNQLAPSFTTNKWTASYGTLSTSGNAGTFTATSKVMSQSVRITAADNGIPLIKGHKYLLSYVVTLSQASDALREYVMYNQSLGNSSVQANVRTAIEKVFSSTEETGGSSFFGIYPSYSGTETGLDVDATMKIENPMIFDLTQMFGSAIADYIYALETANAGAGVAWFRKLFPMPYYAYDAGSLQSVNASMHKMVGFNAWDEEWEVGGYEATGGTKIAETTRIRSKNFIPVVPNTTYSFTNRLAFFEYAADGSYIRTTGFIGDNQNIGTPTHFTTGANTHFITLQATTSYGTTYHNDLCVHISWDGERDGEYEAYKAYEYPLDESLVLRGIPKLSAGNDLYYDGDTYESDGTVTRKYVAINLGSLDWTYNSNNTFNASLANTAPATWTRDGADWAICAKYMVQSWNSIDFGTYTDKSIHGLSYNGTTQLRVYDSAYTDAPTFKTAMSGVYLIMSATEPTTEAADPYQNPQIVDDFGTEEYVDFMESTGGRDVAIPVGHDTFYQANLKAKLEMAPNSPDGDGDYIVRQSGGLNEYVPLLFPADELPAAPTTDGNYVLKCAVVDGTATFTWTAES